MHYIKDLQTDVNKGLLFLNQNNANGKIVDKPRRIVNNHYNLAE
tara:strand:+ start:514 stop:645 length:132 start_codon:yes stop_codon:yes gene_type:complete